jgi:hypothetical protein
MKREQQKLACSMDRHGSPRYRERERPAVCDASRQELCRTNHSTGSLIENLLSTAPDHTGIISSHESQWTAE